MITLTAPILTAGKRAELNRARKWLSNKKIILVERAKEAEDLRARLAEAQTRRLNLEGKAPFDAEAAAELVGVNQQITLLEPITQRKERELAAEIADNARQIENVRRDDIREVLRVPLFDELVKAVEKQLAPLFPKEVVPNVAKVFAPNTEPFRQASFYLNRIAPQPSSAALADAWLAITIEEIDSLLRGEQILSFDHKSGETTFLDARVAERLQIDLDELATDSQNNSAR